MSAIWTPGGLGYTRDPLEARFVGTTVHGDMPFDCPYMTEITENLWLGGCDGSLVLPETIRHIVRLIHFDQYQVGHMISTYLVVPLHDALDQDLSMIDRLARWVNECREDAPTLVHCQAGLNRSGLVAARALILDGVAPADAISLLREKRSPAVLCNSAFEEWLLKG